MPPVPPKKPAPRKILTKTPPTHHTKPVEEETRGKVFLVRDKDYGDGQPVMWGRDMTYAQAAILKELVAGKRLSQSVRPEDQSLHPEYLDLPIDPRSPWHSMAQAGAYVPPMPTPIDDASLAATRAAAPAMDPGLASAKAAALSAVRPIAAAAQQRSPAAVARAKAAADAKAALEELQKAPPMPEVDEAGAEVEDEGAVDPAALAELLGDTVSEEDLAAAHAEIEGEERPAPVNLVELAIKTETCTVCRAVPGSTCTDPSGPITAHAERIQAAAAKLPPATTTDIDPQTGSATA